MPSKLLIAAGAAVANINELPASIRAMVDQADSILVITPRLPTRFQWLTSATDKATAEADERLAVVLDQLEEQHAEVSGELGSDEPLASIEEAIERFEPDHLLVALRSGGQADWQERGLLKEINDRVHVPLTIFEVPASETS